MTNHRTSEFQSDKGIWFLRRNLVQICVKNKFKKINHFYTQLNRRVFWKDTYNIKLVSALIYRQYKMSGWTSSMNSQLNHEAHRRLWGWTWWHSWIKDLKEWKKCCVWFRNQSNNSKPPSALSKSMCLRLQTVQVLNISFSMYRIIHSIYRVKGKLKVLCRNEVKAIHSNFTINVNCFSPRAPRMIQRKQFSNGLSPLSRGTMSCKHLSPVIRLFEFCQGQFYPPTPCFNN